MNNKIERCSFSMVGDRISEFERSYKESFKEEGIKGFVCPLYYKGGYIVQYMGESDVAMNYAVYLYVDKYRDGRGFVEHFHSFEDAMKCLDRELIDKK